MGKFSGAVFFIDQACMCCACAVHVHVQCMCSAWTARVRGLALGPAHLLLGRQRRREREVGGTRDDPCVEPVDLRDGRRRVGDVSAATQPRGLSLGP